MVYDAVGSAAVMVSAVLTLLLGFVYFDIAASIVVVFFMVKSGTSLLRESVSIFMQTAPENFDYDAFEADVKSIPNVVDVGDIHVWCHAPGVHHLTCRVRVAVTELCDCDRIVKRVESLSKSSFDIQHSTVGLQYDESELNRFCRPK